ncbi:Tetratricopeptide repeat-containing protein [Gracilibacillus ureilyticus]|uniref:Tetratricopeptide repeat-containing protein n=1 Tax=Gracilibacillus ureilyticus TaxID=531814 RepID=A0A1H9LNV8_9BACI|nr:tetratricopeptide repeat protein [Gracilibacillus ureilyticus]SER13106.1 Tetratricopeptide repeat-containing protein [Gracilibacillus ureilyticus]
MKQIEVAIDLIHQGEMEEALKLLQSSAKEGNINEKFDVVQIYIELGVQEEARILLEDIIQLEPDNAEAKILLADIFINDNEDEKAITLLNEIDPSSENYVQALLQLADLYQSQGLFEVAENKLIEAKRMSPEEPVIDFALGEFLFSIGEYHKSVIYFEKLISKTDEFAGINIQARLAEAYALNGDFEQALTHFQNLKTDDPELLFRYGFLAYKSERYEIAIKTWENLLELELEYPSVYRYLAEAYEEEGLMKEAAEMAETGVEMDPYNKEMWYVAGKILHKTGRTDDAYRLIEEAIHIDQDYYEALLFLIELYKNEGEFERLIDLLVNKVDINQLDGIFHWELAKAYNEEEQYNDALIAYQNAYNKMDKDIDFLRDFGYFLVEEGRISEAVNVFDQYIKMEPADFEVEQYLERLRNQDSTL